VVARRRGAEASTHTMLSQKKGRRSGEGYQKALQISGRMLPLVGGSAREGASVLPDFRAKRNAWYGCMTTFSALWLGEPFASHPTVVQEGR